jgi:cell division cycle 14
VLILGRSPEEASQVVAPYKPYVPFRDASCGVSTFHLTVFDVIKVRMLQAS